MVLHDRHDLDRAAGSFDPHGLRRIDIVCLENGRVQGTGFLAEAIFESALEGLACRWLGPDTHPAPHVEEHAAQVVDAVGVVGVVVRVEHPVQGLDTRIEQLLAKVCGRVDKHRRAAAFAEALDQQRAAPAPVLRVGRIASAPDRSDARHSAGRTCAKQREPGAHVEMAARGVLL